jgi:exopolyphosphatase/guanosine-5'-triphosphate,3'-diphosphate pyrophosphatase
MYAVIDIGSNTIRLVLYKREAGELRQVLSSKEPAGLAGYLDPAGRLMPQGVRKAVDALHRFQAILESVRPDSVHAFATASLRNITNTREVLDAIQTETGLAVRVLSGSEEAVFDYFGALRTLEPSEGLLVDIGGGSTELVLFREREVVSACSLPMGSLNLYTRFVKDILPTGKELKAIRAYAGELLDSVRLSLPAGAALCGVGGSCRAVCALEDELSGEGTGGKGFPCGRIQEMRRLLRTDRRRLLSALIKAAPDRIHTLLPGMAVLETVARRYGCGHFSASPYGVREGYLLYLLEGNEGGRFSASSLPETPAFFQGD